MNKFESILDDVVPFILEHSESYPRHYTSFDLARGAFISEFNDDLSEMKLTEKAAAIAGCPFADEVGDYGVIYPVADLDDAISQALLQMLMQASAPALRKIVERTYGNGLSLDLLRLGRSSSIAAHGESAPQRSLATRLEEIMIEEVVPGRSLPVDFSRAVGDASASLDGIEIQQRIEKTTGLSIEEQERLKKVAVDVVAMHGQRGNWVDVVHEMLLVDIDEARRTHEREIREIGSGLTL